MDPLIKPCLNRTRKKRKDHEGLKNKFEKTKFRWKCLEKLCKFRRKIQFLTLKNSQNKLSCARNVFSLNLRNSLYFIGRKKLWNSSTLTWVKKSGECNDSNNDSSELMTHPTYWNATKTKSKRNKIEMIKEIRGFDHPIREYLALNSDEEVQVLLHRYYTDTTLVPHRYYVPLRHDLVVWTKWRNNFNSKVWSISY